VHVNSGVSSYIDDSGDRYTQGVTSFGVYDVTKTSDVSRCDVPDESVVTAHAPYCCSPATRQVTASRAGVFHVSVALLPGEISRTVMSIRLVSLGSDIQQFG